MRNHVSGILDKLNVTNRVEAARHCELPPLQALIGNICKG
ncbi:MAG: hypothetical protein DPW16_19025 [Chloroflexi bacterium]|nr:hypothetical protein [Chloroflexota bacterium]